MTRYYVNKKAQTNGDHEVHTATCPDLPAEQHRLYLGDYSDCRPAVAKAKQHYPRANGCYYCARQCHTT